MVYDSFLSFRRLSTLVFVLLLIAFTTNGKGTHLFAAASALNSHHQIRLSPADISAAADRNRRVEGQHDPALRASDVGSRLFSHSKAIGVSPHDDDIDAEEEELNANKNNKHVGKYGYGSSSQRNNKKSGGDYDDDDDEYENYDDEEEEDDDAAVQRRARERLMRASEAKRRRLHRLAQKARQQQTESLLQKQQQQKKEEEEGKGGEAAGLLATAADAPSSKQLSSVGRVEAFDHEAAHVSKSLRMNEGDEDDDEHLLRNAEDDDDGDDDAFEREQRRRQRQKRRRAANSKKSSAADAAAEALEVDNLEVEVDPLTGYGAHRRLIVDEGDTAEHRRHIRGVAKALDERLARSGDSTPTTHDGGAVGGGSLGEASSSSGGGYGHSLNNDAIGAGVLGQRATRKIREHLIAKGLFDPTDPHARLSVPHDLALSEEDYYHYEDLAFEEMELMEDEAEGGDEHGNENRNGEENRNVNVGENANSHSKSLSPSISMRSRRKMKKLGSGALSASNGLRTKKVISAASRSIGYSHRRPLAGAKSRPLHQPTAGFHAMSSRVANRAGGGAASSGVDPNGLPLPRMRDISTIEALGGDVNAANLQSVAANSNENNGGSSAFGVATEEDIRASIVVADLNAHERERFDNDDDDEDEDSAPVGGSNGNIVSKRLSKAARVVSAALAAEDIYFDIDAELEAARGPSVVDPVAERQLLFGTRRERMKAVLREKKLFFPVQQPRLESNNNNNNNNKNKKKSSSEGENGPVVAPADWQSFVCQVCSAIAEEYSIGLTEDTASAFYLRLIEQAEVNVTDLYTWRSGDRLASSSSASSSSFSQHQQQRGSLQKTRPADRHQRAPHTDAESSVRDIIAALIRSYLVTYYEKEVFFRALQTIAATTRPVSVPSVFIREELCVRGKDVCRPTPALYEGGKFAHLRNNLNSAIAKYEQEELDRSGGGGANSYISQIAEERLLKQEIELEDEEDRIALLHMAAAEAEEKEAEEGGRGNDRNNRSGGRGRLFSRSLGIGDTDEHGNKVIIEGESAIAAASNKIGGGRRMWGSSASLSAAIQNDPEAQEASRRLLEEATMRGAAEMAEREERERLRRMHSREPIDDEL